MHKLRILGAMLIAALAMTAVAAATASAAVPPEFNPAKGTFTATSGPGVLKGTLTIKCSSDKVSNGVITGAKTETATVDFEGCESLGVKVNSVGDTKGSGVILVATDGELCYINEKEKIVGLYFTVLPTTGLEIEGVGLKSTVKGTVIGTVSPTNKKQTTGTVDIKKANLKECGGKTAELLANLNGGAFAKAEEETEEKVTFAAATEVTA